MFAYKILGLSWENQFSKRSGAVNYQYQLNMELMDVTVTRVAQCRVFQPERTLAFEQFVQ